MYKVTAGFAEEIMQDISKYQDFGRIYYERLIGTKKEVLLRGFDTKTKEDPIFNNEIAAILWCNSEN